MNQHAESRPITIADLKNYKRANPVKFEHKFGALDLDNLPDNFGIPYYKNLVIQERVRRDALIAQGTPAEFFPPITPYIFPLWKPRPAGQGSLAGEAKSVGLTKEQVDAMYDIKPIIETKEVKFTPAAGVAIPDGILPNATMTIQRADGTKEVNGVVVEKPDLSDLVNGGGAGATEVKKD